MSKRRFIPEIAMGLEARISLSSLGQNPRTHFALSSAGYATNLSAIQGQFGQYKYSGDFQLLQTQIATQEQQVPFGRIDGLGPQTTAILTRMRADQTNHVPGAIGRANHQLDHTIRELVAARIADGSVTIYHR